MKILYLTKYSREGASSRLRSYQYIPYLIDQGIKITVSSLFDEGYLKKVYKGKKPYLSVLKAYIKRFFKLFSLPAYDLLVIEYELFPYFPAWFERIISYFRIPYIVDYDDAIFHNYDRHSNFLIRRTLKDKIDKVMLYSSYVIAGNSYLAERAAKAGAKSIQIIPTVIDISRYNLKGTIGKKSDKIIIGWVGSPSTFFHVQKISRVLKEITEKFDVEVQIVGATGDLGFTENVKFIPWAEETEVDIISNFDIGIMPLQDIVWAKGKCSYKLIQYMGCKLPVISSSVGMNKEVVSDGINGFLADTHDQWYDGFYKYIKDPVLRKQHGQAGFELVKYNFNLSLASDTMASIIKNLK